MTNNPINKQQYDTTELDNTIDAAPIYENHETGQHPDRPAIRQSQ